MVENYYNGVIEQVYNKVGKADRNIVMARYSNEFSIRRLENIIRYSEEEGDVFFAWKDFWHGILPGAYEPFLDTICSMYRKYVNGDFAEFLQECGVYELQRPLLLSYYETGVCEREEHVLLNEVEYEQWSMTEAMANMLFHISRKHPVMIVINRFQRASSSTMRLVLKLIEQPSCNIGMVLGVNEAQPATEEAGQIYDKIIERLEDCSQLCHIGSGGRKRDNRVSSGAGTRDCASELVNARNMFGLMDYEQARFYFQMVEHQIKFEDMSICDETKLEIYLLYARTSILLGDMAKALEMVAEIKKLQMEEKVKGLASECAYLIATCCMYQGKLENSISYARMAKEEAQKDKDERQIFKCELLMAQAQMSGWYNIFFCVQDIMIDEALIEKMMRYNYRNHLAHVYIYAYDNRPEMVAKAYRTEAALFYFSKGVALAKEIGNNELVYDAYQKNTMIAATNGMNEIALLYQVRAYQFEWCRNRYEGRLLTGIGYNLSAMGHNAQAKMYYDRAIELLYGLHMPEEIAEVYYNRALNGIMQGEFAAAEHDLQMTMKVVEKLHLNSIKVCNLSKLYALLALSCILQGDRFGCERYLLSCRQFLNYIIEKEKENRDAEVIHDYAICDDDMFLYTFSTALLEELNGEDEAAFSNMEKAEKFLKNSEGNQFFVYRIYRQNRLELFERLGRTELCEFEKHTLEQREELDEQIKAAVSMDILAEVDFGDYAGVCRVSEEEIEALIKQCGITKDYLNIRSQMDFISAWQKLIDTSAGDIFSMVNTVVRSFANRFSLDRTVYVRYSGGRAQILYNDTGVDMDGGVPADIAQALKESPQGIAVSKIRESFFEHQDIISCFGVDDVCSFVAIPFMKNGELTSFLITYVRMKDNWHGSIERYMLGEDDLHIYQLLFRELEYAINRMEANEKIREMNSKLQAAAVTDVLTSIYNRAGMYERIRHMAEDLAKTGQSRAMGLMFVDLDNFKHYNDTYGHDIGDLILKEMASIFREVSEGKGFVSRFGGDEFILILDTSDRDELESIAKEIYRQIHAANGFKERIEDYLGHAIEVDQKRLITCSIGIAAMPAVREEEDVNSLIRMADDKLYSVKTTEKGHYAFI
ncbi:MAG: diguanylate cyclase [Muribaculaceae bacterium]|nr:diguanylate cyclase [Roseburia sp.]MCM1431399.1 diguanylate cyclase [Muribaculaceae bacterium]MCM1491841.1 diguanylate cyclase [Muribaculaceae bacterium]